MCPHLHCVRILAQRLQPNHKIVDPCVMKNAARGIFPMLGKLQEDLFIVHFQSLRYLIGLIWANRIALRGKLGQHRNTTTGCGSDLCSIRRPCAFEKREQLSHSNRIWTQPIDDIYFAFRSSVHSTGCVHVSCIMRTNDVLMFVQVVSFRLLICLIARTCCLDGCLDGCACGVFRLLHDVLMVVHVVSVKQLCPSRS